jgi:hypothetical protein
MIDKQLKKSQNNLGCVYCTQCDKKALEKVQPCCTSTKRIEVDEQGQCKNIIMRLF